MKLHQDTSELFIPDGLPVEQALSRTTHLAIAAHQDDLEIMAAAPILDCFQQEDRWYSAVVVTDGRGSPRNGLYEKYNDEEMRLVRFKEQRKAAIVGEYAALFMLDYASKETKSSSTNPVDDLVAILKATRPQYVYTHNLADKHDTHIATAIKVIAALRQLPKNDRPEKLFGCEVWRNLDWMVDSDKVPFDLSQQENLQSALLGVFDSQITGGKRYDLASLARRRANATYFESHGVDVLTGLSFGLDMTSLIQNDDLEPAAFILTYLDHFAQDVMDRLQRVK
ncbi:MAG: PIG-L family deacetylase [Chloroflexi bacterium HGW-Chloroflexi-4]|jgi:LmbE family N-acetylglucosaminyl deacetylase|nr:MAG: PIG-L family deacetylase [Chloroflexi bacterium HGW-Chloroflexi-4]